MFELFKNLFSAESVKDEDIAIAEQNSSSLDIRAWKTQIDRADALWEQGKLSEAFAMYGSVIEKNPNLLEVQQRLAGRLKQQGDLAVAYEKLATGLKNQGNIEQAANYYRQAIHIKAMTGSTKEQLLRASVDRERKTPIPLESLKEAAFSFQPLVNPSSGLATVTPTRIAAPVEVESNISPSFPSQIKAIDPQQARDIDWETAQVYLQKALDHLELQEWSQSALACKQATTILPNLAEAYKIWGNALQRMGKTGEAMTCYAKAVEIKPNLAEVYAGLADIYLEQNKLEQAVKHYQKAIIIRPSADIYRRLAQVWQKLGDSQQAQNSIDKALELESPEWNAVDTETISDSPEHLGKQPKSIRSVEVYCSMARQLEQQNKWQEAARCYRKALDISMALPALPPQTSELETRESPAENISVENSDRQDTFASAIPHLQQTSNSPESQLDKAIERYYKQTKLQPRSAKIHTDLGNLYSRKRAWQKAISCYRQAINLQPNYANAHLNYARVLLKIGRRKEFIKEMQLALKIKPKIGSALDRFYLGNALAEKGQKQQAIGFYYKAIVLNPKFIQAYHRMAEALSKQGKYQQAIEFLKQGIEQNPQDAESFFFLGQQFEAIKNWDNAVKTYSKVLQLEPKFPGASQKLNRALSEKLKLSQK